MFNISSFQKIKNLFFPFYKNNKIKFVFNKLQEGFPKEKKTAMFVGGCVRKFLTEEKIDDIDIATSLTTDQIKERFKETEFEVIDSGIKHGTVTLISNNLKLEITTLRKDIKTDGRHAQVEFTNNWQEDSSRRDFTINAIYLDIKGKIFDPQLGTVDLKNKELKFIGDPQKRIEEDYLRIIRYLRFSLEYENETSQETLETIKLNLNGIKNISKERILVELIKILKVKNFIHINRFKILKEIFSLIFPEFKYIFRLDKYRQISEKQNVDYKILLAILLIDQTNNHEYFSHKYKTSNDLKKNLNLISKNFNDTNFLKKNLKRNIYLFGKKHLMNVNKLNYCNNKKTKLAEYSKIFSIINNFKIPEFPYDGNFLRDKGLKEGLIIGQTLELLKNEWLSNNFSISSQKVTEIIEKQRY